MTKLDKVMYNLTYVGIAIAAFCWGWNYKAVNKKSDD